MAMFDPTNKTADECADFLFRWNAKRLLALWWAAREDHATPAARVRELAGDVLLLLLDYDWHPHPYVRAQLGTALRLSRSDARDFDEVVRLARADLAAAAS